MSLSCDSGHDLVTENVTTVVYSQSAINPEQIIASSSHTLEDSPAGIRKYIQDINSEVANASICPTIIVKERLPLTCKSCDYKTFHKHALDRHIQSVHVKVKFYQCQRCEYKTSHSSALKRHESKVHDKNLQDRFYCEYVNCEYVTVHKSALKRHIANRHQKESQIMHECSICDYRTAYEFALQRHCSTVHLKEGIYECSLCEYNTVHKHALDRHVKMVHEKPATLKCEHCDYKSAHRSALRLHYATVHESKETYRCEKCGYETLYKTALNRHQSTVMCGQGEKAASGNYQPSHVTHVLMETVTDSGVKNFSLETAEVVKHQIVYDDKDPTMVMFAPAKVESSSVIPVNLSNIVPVMHTVSSVPAPVPVTRADGLEFVQFVGHVGELVPLNRGGVAS